MSDLPATNSDWYAGAAERATGNQGADNAEAPTTAASPDSAAEAAPVTESDASDAAILAQAGLAGNAQAAETSVDEESDDQAPPVQDASADRIATLEAMVGKLTEAVTALTTARPPETAQQATTEPPKSTPPPTGAAKIDDFWMRNARLDLGEYAEHAKAHVIEEHAQTLRDYRSWVEVHDHPGASAELRQKAQSKMDVLTGLLGRSRAEAQRDHEYAHQQRELEELRQRFEKPTLDPEYVANGYREHLPNVLPKLPALDAAVKDGRISLDVLLDGIDYSGVRAGDEESEDRVSRAVWARCQTINDALTAYKPTTGQAPPAKQPPTVGNAAVVAPGNAPAAMAEAGPPKTNAEWFGQLGQTAARRGAMN